MEIHANGADHQVKELIEVAQAIATGDFDREVATDFQGDLGQLAELIETLRQNLKTLSPQVTSSIHLMPKAGQGVAEISQQAEMSVNSILGLVDEMCADQEAVADMLEKVEQGQTEALNTQFLREITDRSQKSLMSLMSFLSFQDVVRQRAEKVQAMIDAVEGKIRDLLAKFHLKIAEPEEDEEVAAAQEAASDPFQEVVDQTSIDDLFD